MIYDHQVNLSEVHAPVQANVIIRSESGNRPNIPYANAGSEVAKAKQTAQATSTPAKVTPKKNVGATNGNRVDIEKFTGFLQGITRSTSTKKCARSIRIGLQSAGAKIVNHPVAAADWGRTLQQIGYKKINLSFDQPKKGDIYIIDRNASSRYGHIAAYSGNAWVSDYRQKGYAVYRNPNVKYTYYRLDP